MKNIIIGALFIIGGGSGQFAVRGTGSTAGLVVIGVGLVVWGLFQLKSSTGAASENGDRPYQRGPRRPRPVKADKANPVEQA